MKRTVRLSSSVFQESTTSPTLFAWTSDGGCKKDLGHGDLATRARYKLDDCGTCVIENNRTARFNIIRCRTFMVFAQVPFGNVGVGWIGSELGVAVVRLFLVKVMHP